MRLSRFLFLIFVLFFGCGPVENSSTLDKAIYGNTTINANPQFASVLISLKKCKNCHGEWLSFQEADFISNGLVVAKDSENSKLYYRNINAISNNGPKSMPNGGLPALSTPELNNLIVWINTL